jgi:hypothetical protein
MICAVDPRLQACSTTTVAGDARRERDPALLDALRDPDSARIRIGQNRCLFVLLTNHVIGTTIGRELVQTIAA